MERTDLADCKSHFILPLTKCFQILLLLFVRQNSNFHPSGIDQITDSFPLMSVLCIEFLLAERVGKVFSWVTQNVIKRQDTNRHCHHHEFGNICVHTIIDMMIILQLLVIALGVQNPSMLGIWISS
jgi:hypothetical protein